MQVFNTILYRVAGYLMSVEMAIMRYVAPPSYTGREITKEEVSALVNQFDHKYFQPLDTVYKAVTLESVKTFLAKDRLSDFSYIKQYFDCDDFQVVLAGRLKLWGQGIPSGMLFVKGHALNLIVAEQNNELKLFKIEPQNDTISEVTGDDSIVFVIL
jgi:hypothetical protein